jgi:hypothetical protein
MIPYSEQPKVDILYKLFSNQVYKPTSSYVLPSSSYESNILLTNPKPQFVEEFVKEDKPFILSGPEFNNL